MTSFRFLDDVDAQRQLGVDRLTFEELLRTKRLRPVSRQGTLSFYRAADIARLRAELYPETEDEDDEAVATAAGDMGAMGAMHRAHTPAGAPSSSADASPAGMLGEAPAEGDTATPAKPKKKSLDPAMRVHVRLTADLKWYDITDRDLRAWFDQLHPETYARRRANAEFVKQRMEQIIALLDAGQARYDALTHEAGGDEVEQARGGGEAES
jgi:hypothetical protein